MSPRITPGRLADVGLFNWALCRVLARATGRRDIHLFSTMARQRGLFRGWLRFAARMMPAGTLPRYETELTILRIAHLRACRYELEHHTEMGRRVGIGQDVFDRILAGPSAEGWSERERALLSAVDVLLRDKDLDDATWEALRAHYREPQLVELCMLIAHYDMLATFITTLRIEPD